MGMVPTEINKEIFRKYPDIAKILYELRGFNWDYPHERITVEKALQIHGPDANNSLLFDAKAGRLYIRGNDSILHISDPRPGAAAGVEIGSEGSGNRVSYLDFHGSDGVDYSLRIIRFAGANGGTRVSHTGTGVFEINTEGSASIDLRTSGVTRLTIPNNASGFNFPSAITKFAAYGPMAWLPWHTAAADRIIASAGGGNVAFPSAGSLKIPIVIPNGSVLTGYDVYAYDNNNPGTCTAQLHKRPLTTGAATQIGSSQVSSGAGTPGNVTLGQSGLSEVIDNSTTCYEVEFIPSTVNTSNLAVRGARITYTVGGSSSMS